MRARRMIGQGAILDGIFNNLALDGVLQLQGQTLTSNKMTLRAAKLRSQLVILADLATGRFNAALVGDIKGLLIPDRKSTRRTPVTNAQLVCRLLLEKKKQTD